MKHWCIACLLLLVLGGYQVVNGQNLMQRYVNNLINDTTDSSKPRFVFYPTVAYSPETSWEFGFASIYVFHNNRDTTNRLSEIYGFTFVTVEQQYGIWFDHAIYSDQNKWFFLGRLRLQSFPLFYHGIGPQSPKDYIARVDANQILIKERVLREIKPNFYFGLEVDFQRMAQVEFLQKNPLINYESPRGDQGSSNLGLGLGFVYDNRHNVLNVRDGLFMELASLRYDQRLGSDYNFTSILSDNRLFKPMGKRNVLALQMLGQFNIGQVPFNQMALLGGESIMRGYYYGRYRDHNQLAAQVEYRFLPIPFSFTNRIGAAVFAGAGTVFNQAQQINRDNLVYSGGGGVRFLLFPKKDIYTRFDVAFTNEKPGFYLFIGEAF